MSSYSRICAPVPAAGPAPGPAAAPLPPPGVVRVWSIAVDEHRPPAEADVALLDAAECARAVRFHFAEDRALYVAAHAAMRRVLAGYAGVPPERLVFATEPDGKPFLHTPRVPALSFNLSHTRGYALLGVANGRPVGVDVEAMRPLDDDPLAEAVMTAAELAEWRALPAAARPYAILRLWCVKEAWLKARGMGLGLDPGKVESRLGRTDFIPDEAGAPWRVRRLDLGPGFLGAVALAGADLKVEMAAPVLAPLATWTPPERCPQDAL